jgi:hypothetical protein
MHSSIYIGQDENEMGINYYAVVDTLFHFNSCYLLPEALVYHF